MQDLISDSPELMMLITLTFFIISFEVWRQNMHAAGLQVEDAINAVIVVLMWTFAKAAVRMILDERHNALRHTVYRSRFLCQMCGFAKITTTPAKSVSKETPIKPSSSFWNPSFRNGKTSRISASNIVTNDQLNNNISPAKPSDGEPMVSRKASELDAVPGAVAHKLPEQTADHMNVRKAKSVLLERPSDKARVYTADSILCQKNMVS